MFKVIMAGLLGAAIVFGIFYASGDEKAKSFVRDINAREQQVHSKGERLYNALSEESK